MPLAFRDWRGVFAAGCLGALLYAAMLIGPTEWWSIDLLESVVLNTPFFLSPFLFALFRWGRVRWLGAAWLMVAVTAAHYGATWLALQVGEDFEEGHLLPGAIGGAFGASVSFLAVSLLHGDLRDRRHVLAYGAATAVLTVLGAVGVAWMGETFLDISLRLYIPWQVTFAAALTWAFRDHIADRAAAPATM